jgi:hypothetical protein
MANVDRPTGFKASKTLSGAPVASVLRKVTVAARSAGDTSGDIYRGQPIAVSDTGVVTGAASASADIIGVVAGVGVDNIEHGDTGMFEADNLEKRYLADAEAGVVWYYPADDVLFEVQTGADLDLSPGMGADFGLGTTDFLGTETGHGSQTTGQSLMELSSANATGGDVRVVEDVTTPDNDTSLANARHLVKFLGLRYAGDSA